MYFIIIIIDLVRPKAAHNMYKDQKTPAAKNQNTQKS